MKKIILILVICTCVYSCDKEKSKENEIPTQVTFEYGGENVTYGVVKKTYTTDANGNRLQKPVTKFWLDRNLGAQRAAIAMNDTLASGDLFQWGRRADGHQKRNSLTTDTLAYSISPENSKFILGSWGGSDWLLPNNDALWNGTQNLNCSCPSGWRVPTSDELGMEIQSWDTLSLSSAFSSPLKWVATGERGADGKILYANYWAFMWSSTPLPQSEAMALQIISSTYVGLGATPRNWGHAVRCIRDN